MPTFGDQRGDILHLAAGQGAERRADGAREPQAPHALADDDLAGKKALLGQTEDLVAGEGADVHREDDSGEGLRSARDRFFLSDTPTFGIYIVFLPGERRD